MLPTPAAVHFATRWAQAAAEAIRKHDHDQDWMAGKLGVAYRRCTHLGSCRSQRQEVRTRRLVGTHGCVIPQPCRQCLGRTMSFSLTADRWHLCVCNRRFRTRI